MVTLRHILIYLALAGAAAYFIVLPFVAGLRHGPKPPEAPDAPGAPMRPLRWITGLYGRFLLIYLVGTGIWATYGYLGGGSRGQVCVNTNVALYSSPVVGEAPRHGAALTQSGYVQACALHPNAGQWTLYLLTRLPAIALWACVLLLTLRLIRQAAKTGPFTAQAAATMYVLGWVVVVGSMAVGGLGVLGADVLTGMLMASGSLGATGIFVDVLVRAPLEALVPVPALVGAALLTFSHITRVGAAMDEEIKATV